MNITQILKMSKGVPKRATLVLAVLAGLPTAAFAATTYTFTPTTAGTYDWTVGGNWAASGVPVSDTHAAVVLFPDITTALTGAVAVNTDPATLTLNTLTLNGLTAATAAANNIGTAGNTWTFDGTTPTLNLNGKSGATTLSYSIKPNIVLNQSLTFAGIGTAGLTIPGVISGSGMGIINNSKPSTITLNGSVVNTFTGGVTLYGGMVGAVSAGLAVPGALAENFANLTTSPNDNLIDPSNVLTLAGGRLSLTGKNNTPSSQTFASTILSANTCSVITLTATGSGSMIVDLKAITRNPGGTLVFGAGTGTGNMPNGTTLQAKTTNANETSGILGPWAFVGNATYACNNGSGQIVSYTIPGANAFTTAAGLSGMNDANQNFSMTGSASTPFILTGNIIGNTLSLLQSPERSWSIANNGNAITLNGINAAGSGAGSVRTISGAGNLVIGANKELVLNVFRPLNIACPIVDWNGTGAGVSRLTYSSAQTADGGYALTFSGTAPNTYSGITSVAGGSLTLNKSAGVNSIPGDIFISSGALIWGANNQIADIANLTFFGTGKVSGTPIETVASVTTTGNTGGFLFGGSTAFTVTGALALTGNQGPAAVTASSYGLSGTAAMTVGSLSLDNAYYSVGTASGDTATFNLNGNLTGANTSTLNTAALAPKFVLSGIGTHTHNFNITSGTTTISPPISETTSTTASLTKTGAGTLALNGVNTYSGATAVSEGKLLVNGSTAAGSAITVALGATLGGSGTINGSAIFDTGALAVFTQGAPLTFASSLTLNNNKVHLNLPADLAEGNYIMAYNASGNSGTFAAEPVIDTGSVVSGASAKILMAGGVVTLKVYKATGTIIRLF